ncbi:MAG: lipopolysaccharide heptosyltransferase II [Candidatus Krumholzibacteria bacterium]|nr:lipopolysaccharide heptosyltransferase II [Candidatus Krumholzibacteria bacterium]
MRKGHTENSITSRSESDSILVLVPNWLGDAVMSLPFFDVLRGRHPDARIFAGCLEYVRPIFKRSGSIDRMIPWERGDGSWTRAAQIRQKMDGAPKVTFILPPSFSSALTAWLARSGERLGYGTDMRGPLLTQSIHRRMLRKSHLTEAYVRLIDRWDGRATMEIPIPRIGSVKNGIDAARKAGIEGRYFIIAPGAKYGSAKMWPGERYSSLIGMISRETGWLPVLSGSVSEKDVSSAIVSGSPVDCLDLTGNSSIDEMIDIMSGAELVAGNDSGAVHVAGALGVPLVTIFGSTSPRWTAPRGPNVRILSSSAGCSPCFKKECPLGTMECFDEITVEKVMAEVRAAISAGPEE